MRRAMAGTGTVAGSSARVLIDATPWPVSIVGQDRIIQAVNAAYCESFDVAPEQAVGRRIGARMAPSEWAKYETHLERAFAGELYPIRFRWPRPEGALDFLVVPSFVDAGRALMLNSLPAALIAALPRRPADAAHGVADLLRGAHAAIDLGAANAAAASARAGDVELLRLTPRQWEITRRISEGDRVTMLAEDLGISANTVRNHLKEIFRKLHVSSQAQLVRRVKCRAIQPR